ncbi:hypothetical protein F441_19502 [Phytophthora nicotianae CJ01A1]|uniref:RxLR effector protein n=6 Tax=Phytophthora nicotianae TaxID=4792 RepID=V9E363_PHYNI|nr:hypothetical protein F443_20314 [Phytophthora nicotianae P1569]ETL79964.1 hypothetical protein L917_19490 [Phytophthora nicotianae]ETO62452.1 hypothetical protein F444_19634 [Phytophthora nicotianae P1976]ETP02787.1 hypothetical protein F441_20185 [Phytophthora nicotianae CJ01A1]ETP31693.1 hypothetical protein F442_19447 [Phytophthora nicotianae P10297]
MRKDYFLAVVTLACCSSFFVCAKTTVSTDFNGNRNLRDSNAILFEKRDEDMSIADTEERGPTTELKAPSVFEKLKNMVRNKPSLVQDLEKNPQAMQMKTAASTKLTMRDVERIEAAVDKPGMSAEKKKWLLIGLAILILGGGGSTAAFVLLRNHH